MFKYLELCYLTRMTRDYITTRAGYFKREPFANFPAEVFNAAAGIESVGHIWILHAQLTTNDGFAREMKCL